MTYAELLDAVQTRTAYSLVCGDADTTLRRAISGQHADALLGEILLMIYQWCHLHDVHALVERAAVVNALGPLRRRFMAGAGCAHDFLRLNRIIEAIDAAFDAASQQREIPSKSL
jgi:hypothetical protein